MVLLLRTLCLRLWRKDLSLSLLFAFFFDFFVAEEEEEEEFFSNFF
jgi:hypothetical protein